jgi:predicted dehydrogenase
MLPIKLIIIGAGNRGTNYADYALLYPEQAKVVGVADPREHYRTQLAVRHSIPPENVFTDWRQVAERPRFADAVIIATPDVLHAEPAIAFAELAYHILLEKPMAPNAADCRRIAAAAQANGEMFAVCHVLRYTTYTKKVKAIVDSGRLGEIISIQHLEPVGYWHQAHSFVRGNWRNERESAFMLLAKSCHDLDWIRHIMGKPCSQVSSFGSLKHFRAEHKPEGAADRCLECAIEPACPYSAPRIYLGRVRRGETGWPVNVLTPDLTEVGVIEALRTGPYGRCVYACDNDVVDHQVVNMQFENGATASFTMTAFNRQRDRETRIFGTRGELYGNGRFIEIYDFLTDATERIDAETASDGSISSTSAGQTLSGHGGGDLALMTHFVNALLRNDPSLILSGPAESLESHLMVFAAEASRCEGRVVDVAADW